jgi:5-methylcytosine-specific restriction endonuclease McrA
MEKFICSCHGKEYSNKENLKRHLKYELDPSLKIVENLQRRLKRQNATIEEKERESKQAKLWKERNKEKWLTYNKNYRSNPDVILRDTLTRKIYQAKPEIKQKRKEYDASVSDSRREYWRRYYLEHKEEFDRRRIALRNTPRGNMLMRLWTTNRRTIEKGFSPITEEKRNRVYNKYKDSEGKLICCLCFNPILEGEDALEHFIPISRYKEFPGIDLNSEENLGPAHGQFSKERCNNKKFDKTLQEWFKLYPDLLKQRSK